MKVGLGPDLVPAFRPCLSALVDNCHIFRISFDDHVEVDDCAVQHALAAESHCSATKCRKIVRFQLNGAIKIRNCEIELAPGHQCHSAIVNRDIVIGHQAYGLIIVFDSAVQL